MLGNLFLVTQYHNGNFLPENCVACIIVCSLKTTEVYFINVRLDSRWDRVEALPTHAISVVLSLEASVNSVMLFRSKHLAWTPTMTAGIDDLWVVAPV